MTLAHFPQRHLRSAPEAPVRVPSAVALGSLEDGMMVCLGLLERDPERFESVAVAWHARWCASRPSTSFAESRVMLTALEALTGCNPAAAALELSAACRECRLDELASVFDTWLERRSEASAPPATRVPPERPSAA